MGITYDDLGEDGLVSLTVTGQPGRAEHAAHTGHVRAAISAGRLRAVIIDAGTAELPVNSSFSREIWDDLLSELGDRPFAYIPPVGHDAEARRRMIADPVTEWGSCSATVGSVDEARAWCRATLAAQGGC